MPPSELYEPISYKNGKWQGISYDEWEYNRSIEKDEEEKLPYKPNANEMMLAQAQMQVTKTANQLVKSQKEQAETLKELTKKEKRIQQLEEQQAQTMLEIAKLKGE